jgi:hypothetical protein
MTIESPLLPSPHTLKKICHPESRFIGMRDLPITKTDILLTHSCHWADTSTLLRKKKDVMKD